MSNGPISVQSQTVSIGVETYSAAVTVTPAAVMEKVQLSNKLSKYEQSQIAEWVTERFDDLGAVIQDGAAFVEALQQAFSGSLSPDSFLTLIKLVEQLFK